MFKEQKQNIKKCNFGGFVLTHKRCERYYKQTHAVVRRFNILSVKGRVRDFLFSLSRITMGDLCQQDC